MVTKNSLKFFSTSQVDRFKNDIKRLESKRKIAKRTIEFATPFLVYKEDYPAFISSTSFKAQIGKVDSDDFQMWLKRNLFIVVDSTYAPGVKCKGYVINRDFFSELVQLTSPNSKMTLDDIIERGLATQFKAELTGKKSWEYKESDNGRKHNNAILAPRNIKASLFKDYNNYDISSAAPTILFQLFHRIFAELGTEYNRFNELSAIKEYIENKDEVRARIANDYSLDLNVVKKIINALFNKAPFSKWDKTTIFKKYLESDYDKMNLLQKDDYIRHLRRDIRRMWMLVNSTMNPEVKSRRGKKSNWFFYMVEESKIRRVIEDELMKLTGKKDVFYFLEHDGFRLHKKFSLNMNFLVGRIKNELGYEVRIEME
jgi:hypothetical protein